jgi:hypothetical protein
MITALSVHTERATTTTTTRHKKFGANELRSEEVLFR